MRAFFLLLLLLFSCACYLFVFLVLNYFQWQFNYYIFKITLFTLYQSNILRIAMHLLLDAFALELLAVVLVVVSGGGGGAVSTKFSLVLSFVCSIVRSFVVSTQKKMLF